MGDIEDIFLGILLPKTKTIFAGIIYRPPNNISFFECFNKHLNHINLDNGKDTLKENQAMQNRTLVQI